MKILLRILTTFIILGVIGIIAGTGFFWYQLQPPSQVVEEVQFVISQGDTMGIIASNLEETGLIKSAPFFSLYSRIRGTASLMKTGLYFLEGGNSAFDIHNILLSGKQKLFRVTIPEGWTVKQIAGLLDDKGITDGEGFIEVVNSGDLLTSRGFDVESLEGFLYPDTYLFQLDFPPEKTALVFIDNFFKNFEMAVPNFESLTSGEIYNTLVLASVVEREYRVNEEAPLISSVFHNRIEQGIKLQSCATVAYVITDIQGKNHPERLFFRDLEIESPFNTYKYEGLPPAPISNPGYTALEAAFNPAETDFLFFVVKDSQEGTHTFSRSYNEHLSAKNLFIKSR